MNNIPTNSAVEDFMPFSCTVLNSSLREYAANYLHETEEIATKAVEEVAAYLTRELGIEAHEMDKDMFLLFLRYKRFNIKEACNEIKKAMQFFESYPYMFEREDSEVIRRTIESKIVGYLPYRDSKARTIIFIKIENWNLKLLKADDLIYSGVILAQVPSVNAVSQVACFIVIVDFKNVSLKHFTSLSGWIIFAFKLMQTCCPYRLKQLHVVNAPLVIRKGLIFMKPFVNPKIWSRITIHKYGDWNNLHSYIPPAILPEELGGFLGPFSNDHWGKDMAMIEKLFERFRLFSDVNKRKYR